MRESLCNYEDDEQCQQIFKKLESKHYGTEGKFVLDLDEKEIAYLNSILNKELKYAKQVENDIRVKELNEVFELLL